MNNPVASRVARSVCPHDCPSACALDVDIVDATTIGRVRGAQDDPYTAGVICEKVARYAERIHHPDRLTHPMRRVGRKGEGRWERISWDEAFAEIIERWTAIERDSGPEAIWPYFYAGTMGHVQRDGIDRLRHAVREGCRFESSVAFLNRLMQDQGDVLVRIVREDGVTGLFKGGGPTVVRAMALNMGMLASNDQVCVQQWCFYECD